MLELVLGRAGTGKTHAFLQEMHKEMERAPLGPALVLLVPEHMTYQAERALARSVKKGRGFLRGYVFGFRRLAWQVFQETGGAVYPRITEVGRRLLLRRLMERRQQELGFFARAARQRRFSEPLSEAIKELKKCRVTPARLREIAGSTADAQLAGKLQDLALLSEDFAAAMEGRMTDGEDMLDELAERIPSCRLLQGAEVYVDGFLFFHPQEQDILRALLRAAACVHVACTMDPREPSPENRRQAGIFRRSWETFRMLRAMAEELGTPCRIRSLRAPRRFLQPALGAVEQQLFRFPPKEERDAGGIHIVEAANRRIEAEAAASDILRLCREQGYRYREIGILVRDADAYDGLLPLVLEDRGIPYFKDSKRPAAHHPLAELLRSALEVLRGWRYEAVFRCLRTGFFPISRERIDQLENYVLEFGIRGQPRWTMEEPWPWHRRSLEDDAGDVPDAWRQRLEGLDLVRREAARPLAALAERARKAKTARELTEALYRLLEDLEVPKSLAKWAEEDEGQGKLAMAREHSQIWEDITGLFDQIVAVSGDERMDRATYEAILGDGLDALEMALIPPGLDYVSVASFDQNSLANLRAIYILGANEGTMPRRSEEKGLLSDADRLRLREAGIDISAGGQEGSFAEKFLLYRGFTEAREYLWVSYALADAEGGGLAPAALVQRMRHFLPGAEFLSIPLESLPQEAGTGQGLSRMDTLRLSDRHRAVSGLSSALRGLRETGRMPSWWQDAYNWLLGQEDFREQRELALLGLFARASEGGLPPELARELFAPRRRMHGSVTRFESFHRCPFQHFAQYGLQLSERRLHGFQAPDLGNLLHGALREFGEELKKAGRRWGSVGEEECHAIVAGILERIAPRLQNELLLSTAQYKHQLERIRILAERSLRRLIAWDAVSRFHPQVFEHSFGGDGAPALSYELDGARLEIRGQIDRMDFDESGAYFLVVDYKTGNAYINLLEVYYGLRMQLLAYLLAASSFLASGGRQGMLPAGMLYCFLRHTMCKAERRIPVSEARERIEQSLRMPGWVLADPEVVRSIDSAQRFIKVRLTKDGGFSKAEAGVKTMEEFRILMGYIDFLLEDTGRAILSGEIAVSPCRLPSKKHPCGHCLYQALCGFDPRIPGYAWRDLPKLEDAELMDTMELKSKRLI